MDDYSSSGQVPIFPPPQFLPKQQIQPNLPYSSSSSSVFSSSSPSLSSNNANSANPSTNYHSSSNSPITAHSIHLPTDPSTFKELQFNLIQSPDYSSSNTNSQQYSAYLIESIKLNGVIAGKFNQQTGGLIRFHLKQLPVWARLAFFAKRIEPPTLTNHELVEWITADGSIQQKTQQQNNKRRTSRSLFEQIIFKKENSQSVVDDYLNELNNLEFINQKLRIKRSSLNSISASGSTVSIEYLEYFEPGLWFFVFINDANHEQKYTLHLNITKLASVQFACANDCNGHGFCEQGKCVCDNGFIEPDCSRNVCPVLCKFVCVLKLNLITM